MRETNKISYLSFYYFFSLLLFCNLFFASSLWALEGDKKWSFKTGGGIISSPAISRNGTIYIGSADNKIYAINPDGSVRWSFSGSTAGITSSPAIGPDGIIYAGSYDYHLYAIHEDGTQKWAYNTGGQVNSSPAIGSDGTIYVGSGGSGSEFKLHAINPDGSGKWSFDCPVAWSSPAIGFDGTIYVGSTDGNLYAIYQDGSLKWKFAAGEYIYASPAIGKDETIYIGANNGRLYAITPAGTQKWVFETGNVNFNSFFSPAIGSDGTIYAGSNFPNNKLYAINPDGTLKWAFDTGEVYLSTPAISAEGTIYIGSKLKKLFALNPDGTKKWEYETQGFVESSPVIGTDGTIYIGSTDTYLYSIYGAAGGPAASPWPMFRNNIHHTGCPDSDADGLFDYWERYYFFDLSQGRLGDIDNDRLRNLLEFQMGLNPADSDTDNDGMSDGWEATHSFDPLDENDAAQDADEDGISNLDEYLNGFDPHIKAPEVQFSVEPTSGLAPLTVAFQVTSTGEITSWNWDFGDGSSSSEQNPTHIYLETGTYTIVLDADGPGGSDTFSASVDSINTAPVADAGPNQTVNEGTQVQLNGSQSHDLNLNMVAYEWVQLDGPSVVIVEDDTSQAVFVAPDIGSGGAVLEFQLTVTDKDGLKDTDTCIVNVSWVNQPPAADAGVDQIVDEGLPVTLSGSNSYDPDDAIVEYQWRQIDGPDVSIAGSDKSQALITAPDVGADGISLQFELKVTDGYGLSAVDWVLVNVTWSNDPPVADAGANLNVSQTDLITLDASNSYDRDGIDIYFWRQVSGTEATLSDSNAVKPIVTFAGTKPAEASLVFELTVTDTGGLKATDSVIVNIVSDNLPPKADAGLNRNVNPNEEVMLDGLNSRDPEGAIASYEWKQIKGPTVILSRPNFVRPTFLAPEVDTGGVALTFELTVSDRSGLQDSDTVIVNVIKANAPPIAMAGGLQTVMSDEIITLTGTDSYDPDGSIATYRWRQLNGPKVILSDPSNVSPTFSVPDSLSSCASLEFELTVTDNNGLSDTDIAIVNICDLYSPPVADAGSDLIVEESDTVTLDASNSYSPESDPITYEWKQIAGPQVILSDAAAPLPTFVAPEVEINVAELIFQLKVKDNHQLCDTSEVSVFVKDNGLFDTPPDAISFTTYDNQHLLIQCNGGASLVKLKAIDPEDILDSNNRPGNLIYGLMDIQIKVAKPGDTAYLTVHLPKPAPDGYQWFIWDEKNGWRDSGSYAVFNNARDLVTIILIDGGFGDADVTANSTIVDPAGLGTPDTGVSGINSDSGGGGGGGGCFIGTSGYGFNKITELLQKYFD